MNIKLIVATIAAVSLTACATAGTNLAPDVTRINFPDVNSSHTVRIGESMLKKAKVYAYDAIQLDEEFKVGDGVFLQKVRIPPQKLKAKKLLKNNVLYSAEEAYSYDALLGERQVFAGLCIPKDTEKEKWRVFLNGVCTALGTKDLPSHTFTTAYDADKPSLTRELIYNGRVKDEIKIIYRELSNDRMRPAFQQDLQYDLSNSDEIAFREVILEVRSADNREITYTVLSHFEDLE
jgi:hypothetical protein